METFYHVFQDIIHNVSDQLILHKRGETKGRIGQQKVTETSVLDGKFDDD